MNKKMFAEKVLKTTRAQLDNVLAGRRNMSYGRAKIAAHTFNTTVDVWLDSSLVLERQAAWKRFEKN